MNLIKWVILGVGGFILIQIILMARKEANKISKEGWGKKKSEIIKLKELAGLK